MSVDKYKEATGWNEFLNIVGIEMGNTDAEEKCDAPTITFDNNERKLNFSCGTQGANYIYSISSDDIVNYMKSEGDVPLTGVYTITVYATTDDKQKSETVTAKLVWVNAEIDTDVDVISANTKRGVIVSAQNGNIVISGTVNGETVSVYNVAGSLVKNIKATNDNTVIGGLNNNSVYVVKIGGTSVKVLVGE